MAAPNHLCEQQKGGCAGRKDASAPTKQASGVSKNNAFRSTSDRQRSRGLLRGPYAPSNRHLSPLHKHPLHSMRKRTRPFGRCRLAAAAGSDFGQIWLMGVGGMGSANLGAGTTGAGDA